MVLFCDKLIPESSPVQDEKKPSSERRNHSFEGQPEMPAACTQCTYAHTHIYTLTLIISRAPFTRGKEVFEHHMVAD